MAAPTYPPLPDTPYWRHYQGRFAGLLHWPDFEALWQTLEQAGGAWYIFEPGNEVPTEPASFESFRETVATARALVSRSERRFTGGSVYVDDRTAPEMVKIFAPDNMGASCGCSGMRILPRWILSRARPDPIPPEPAPEKPGWLARALKR